MAQPNIKDLLVEGPLRNVSIQYKNQNYLADRVFPIIDKIDPKSKIARYLKGAWFRDEAGVRGPGSRAVRGGYPVDFVSIATDEYAFAKEVTDEDRRFSKSQMAPPLQPDQDALEFAADKIDLKKEVVTAAMVTAGTWSSMAGEDANGLWSPNDGTNTFVNDVLTRIETIRSNTGIMPNRMIIDHATYNKLKENTLILDRIRYTQQGVLTSALLAAMFDLETIFIATTIKNTAKETKAGTEFTTANIWEKNAGKGSAFLYFAPASPGLKVPSAGYMARPAYEDGQPRRVTRWREAAEHQDVYEVAEECDIVQVGADLGFFWYDTHTT
jgi:hypothetical protein